MSMELENKLKEALADIDSFRTDSCLDTEIIGRYADGELPGIEKEKTEEHLHSCLYCLKQLNDMTAMLHCQKQAASGQQTQHVSPSLLEKLKGYFVVPAQFWRYSTFGLATVMSVLLLSTYAMRKATRITAPRLNPDSFVTVSALDKSGRVIGRQRGALVSDDGYIEGNLQELVGASNIKVTLHDGSTREVKQFWKNEETDLAVMKIDGNDYRPIPVADISNITIGQRIFAVPDTDSELVDVALVSDIKSIPVRLGESDHQLIQVATQQSTKRTSKLVDENGSLVGYVIDEEKNINLAAPAGSYRNIIKASHSVPVADLKDIQFSTKALNAYLKGVMASDLHRWDEAIRHFKAALSENKQLEGAYILLGYAYYQKNDFRNEAATYEAALKINPKNPDALYSLAWNLESQGRYAEALPLYEKAHLYAPDDKEVIYQLGISYLACGNKGKALVMAKKLEQLDPGQAGLLRRLMK